MADKVSFEPQPAASGGVSDVTAVSPLASSGGATPAISLSGVVPVANGGTGAATGAQNLVFATPNGSSGAPGFRALVTADLPSIPGGSGSVNPSITQTTNPIAFNAELYMGPTSPGYSYSSGAAGYFYRYPFQTTVSRLWLYTDALGVNVTLRLRNAAGTQLWSDVMNSGSTFFSASPGITVGAGVQVQFSIEPGSSTISLNNTTIFAVGVL